jgi:pilus assembly protein Flp/PilA
MSVLREFVRDARGATAIEYALIITGIALAIVTALTALGPQVSGSLNRASAGFSS